MAREAKVHLSIKLYPTGLQMGGPGHDHAKLARSALVPEVMWLTTEPPRHSGLRVVSVE